jgi:hypothetical protein
MRTPPSPAPLPVAKGSPLHLLSGLSRSHNKPSAMTYDDYTIEHDNRQSALGPILGPKRTSNERPPWCVARGNATHRASG